MNDTGLLLEKLYQIPFLLFKTSFTAFQKKFVYPRVYLTMGVLSGLSFIAPPISLQQQFASKIEAIEHQKELIKQSIKEVETLFNSRMDYYFN